jgi:8-hydroxy-5-deazaflavin:NADPH oxidoreductase
VNRIPEHVAQCLARLFAIAGEPRFSRVLAKAFNTVFAQHMKSGKLGDQRLTAFVASDDEPSRRQVMELARSIGFDAVDAGPLKSARLLEPLAYLNIQLGYAHGMGTQIGFKLLHG